MQALTHAYVATTNFVRDRVEAAKDKDRGQAIFEYLGMAVVIAAIIAFLATQTNIGDKIAQAVKGGITDIMSPNSGSGSSGDGGT